MDFSAFIQSKEMEISKLQQHIIVLQEEVETYKALHNQVDYVKNQIKGLMVQIKDHPESVQESIVLCLAGELGLSQVEIPFKNELTEPTLEITTEVITENRTEPTPEPTPEPTLEITTEVITETKPEVITEVKPEKSNTETKLPERPKRQSQAGFDARVKKWIKKLNSLNEFITEDELSLIETEIGYWDKFPVPSELVAALDAAKEILYPSQSEDNEIEDEVEDDGIEVEETPQLDSIEDEVEEIPQLENNNIEAEEVEVDYLLKLNDDDLTESELNTIWTEIEGHYGDNIPQSLRAANRVAWYRLDQEDNNLGYEDPSEDNETITLQEDVQEDQDTTEQDNASWVAVLENINDIATFKQWEEWINQEMEKNPDGILPITIDALESARVRVFSANKESQVSLYKTRLENAKTLEEHQEVCNSIRDSGIVEVSLIQTLEATRDALKAQIQQSTKKNRYKDRAVRVNSTVEVTGDTVVVETKPETSPDVIAIGGIDTDENSITIKDFTGAPVTLKRHSDDYIFPIGTKLYDTVMDHAYIVCDWDELEIIHPYVNRDGSKVPVISLFDELLYLTINSLEKTVLLSDKEADQLIVAYKKKVQAMVETGDVV